MHSDPTNLFPRAQAIEAELIDMVWKTNDPQAGEEDVVMDEKKVPRVTAVMVDEESGEMAPEARPTHLMNTILVGFTL